LSKTNLRADFKLGYLGAGQLARMSALQAFRYGIQIGLYTDRSGNEPVEFMTPYSTTGSFDDTEELTAFASEYDILTLENEFLSSLVLREVQEQSGTPIYPSPSTFAKIENKLIEKQTFEKAGIPVTPYALVGTVEEIQKFGNKHGWPFVLKSSKGGYDGYGNETVNNPEEAEAAYRALGGFKGHKIIAEAFIDFSKELAVQVARNETGSVVYPCCETIQENHINTAVISPAPIDPEIRKEAQKMALSATEALDARGLFAYEFFLTEDGNLLLNESAPRPHNSGHYTIEGCITSQFENHVRAVMGLPLGSTEMRKPVVVMMNLLGKYKRKAKVNHFRKSMAQVDGHLHVYGKLQSKIGRKMGHYTLLGDDLEAVYAQAKEYAEQIQL